MLILTVVTVVMLPYSILSGLFGMNVNLPMQTTDDDTPLEQRDAHHYFIRNLPFIGVISTMVGLSLCIFCSIWFWWVR